MKTIFKISFFLTLFNPIFNAENSLAKSIISHEERSFDTDNDKKIDYMIVTRNKKTSEIREDLNHDGTFDQQTVFFARGEEFIKTVERKKIDQIPRKKISYWRDEKFKKIISLTQIDKNDDGKWDQEYRSHSELLEFKQKCVQEESISESQYFASKVLNIVNETNEYILTESGFKVEKACFAENSKDWFLKNLEFTLETGLGCLEKLKNEENGNGALKNIILLKNLLAPLPSVQILCNESTNEYEWTGAVAHGTTGPTEESSRLQHPGISINPEYLKESKNKGPSGEVDLRKTIFHELFHNLGYLHSHDIEYAYACESCCFTGSDDVEVKSSSCKICKKSYSSSLDFEYIIDLNKFSELIYKSHLGTKVTINYLKENPGSLDGLTQLSKNLSGVFSPVGIELSKIISSEFKNLTEDQRSTLLTAVEYADQDFLKPHEVTSKILAMAYFYVFAKHDPLSALELIEKETPNLKTLFKSNDIHKHDKYIKRNIHEKLMTIIDEVFINHNYGKHSGRADKEEELKDLSYKLLLNFEK